MSKQKKIAAGLALLALAAWVGATVWVGAHRTLHVVNGLDQPLNVRLDDEPPFELPAGQVAALPVGEGRHRVEVTCGTGHSGSVEAAVETGWAARLVARPAFVVNPFGVAWLRLDQGAYGEGARAAPPRLLRDEFVALDGVDVLFAPLPAEVEDRGAPVLLTRLDLVRGGPLEVLSAVPADQRLDWAERRLHLEPWLDPLLAAYLQLTGRDEAGRARALAWLEEQVVRPSAPISWHRAWQDLARRAQGDDALRARYVEWRAKRPDHAGLLYLSARLEPRAKAAQELLGLALAKDGELAHAWHALALQALATGDPAQAVKWAGEAARLRPDDDEMKAVLDDARLASGDPALIEAVRSEQEAQLRAKPAAPALRRLLQALVAAGAPADALARAHGRFADDVRAAAPPGKPADATLLAFGEALLAEARLDGDALLAKAGALPASSARANLELAAHLLRGDAAAAGALATGPLADQPRPLLLVAACAAGGPDAAAWRERAAAALATGTGRERLAAEALRAPGPPDPAALDDLPLPAVDGGALRLVLAAAHPAAASALRARAAALARGHGAVERWLRARAGG